MGPSRPSIFLPLFLSVVVCVSASLGSSSSDLVESELLKVPISEFTNSVRSTIDVVQQVATLVSTFTEFANSVRLTIEVVPQVASLVSRFAEFANSVRLTIEVVQQVASLVSKFAEFAISVRLTIAVVQKVASLVSRFAGAFGDFHLSKAIADCLDLLDLSADKLTRTLSASRSPSAVNGQGFIARDMTFENTARPQKHQAVAFRSDSDLSVLFRCAIRGYQDTLYEHSLRQFYRECQITGTVDFIYGDGTVVFQNCRILARLGLPDQKNTITAQGRKDPSESSGFSIQFSNISAEPDLLASLNSTYTYLGRPWKLYSRTVIMQSYMSNAIRQEGWIEWNGNFALYTLFYGEFMNNGPGAGLGSRVKWPGFQTMNDSAQAYNFSVGQFILGNDWLPSIQNGNLAHFWEAKWVPSTNDFKIASHKPPHCTVQTVAEVIDPNRKIWKRELLKEWLSPEDLEAVLAIPIAAVNRDDLLIWHHNPSGVYFVTSGYALAKQICHNSNGSNKPSRSLTLGTDFWNSIWALDIPPKIRHFWWRVCHNLSATKLGLFRRKCASSGECPICRKDDESVEHLLFDCPWTKAVWFGSDNKSVISLCVSETVPPWEYSAIILDIRGLASSHSLSFSWTSRNNNEAGHWVAKACLSKALPVNWAVCPPAPLASILTLMFPIILFN
ncbi:unnamed protein product [Camellia sinensis]